LNHKYTNGLNRSRKRNENEVVIKNFTTKTVPGADGFSAGFYHTLEEELTPMLHKYYI
jgi:hypothetical protein